MKVTIISSVALAAMVAAAPTAGPTEPSGTGVMYLNGQSMNQNTPLAAHGPCTADDDVKQCAMKIAASWTLPGNVTSTESSLTWSGTCRYNATTWPQGPGTVGCQITLPYIAKFQNCKMQDPVLTQDKKNHGAFDCNSSDKESCQYQMIFGTVSTNTTAVGYKIGAQLSASASIGIVSTSLQVSADFTQNWSGTQTDTTSETRTFNLGPGDICDATTVQFRTECDTNIESTYMQQTYGKGYNIPPAAPYGYSDLVRVTFGSDDRQLGGAEGYHLCAGGQGGQAFSGSDYYFDGIYFDGQDMICEAITNAGTVAMDVGALSGLEPWALQGCMFT
jgi:hypothetical protein